MGNNQEKGNLEDARARLERALSKLAQGATASKLAIDHAKAGQIEATAGRASLEDRLHSIEQENLRLHEQVATLSLSGTPSDLSDNSGRIEQLEAEKHAVERNYDLLKRQYTSLQDEFEGLQDSMGAAISSETSTDVDTLSELQTLRSALDAVTHERDQIRHELDQVISELEQYLMQNNRSAGGVS